MSGDHLERLEALLAQLDKFDRSTATGHCLHTGSPNILGEILLVSVDCDYGHGIPVGAGGATGEDLRAALDELKQLRAIRTCGEVAKLFNDDEHVCVLPFGHGPQHRDVNGTRWQVYDAPPESDDALKELARLSRLAAPQQPAPDGDWVPFSERLKRGGEAASPRDGQEGP